MSGSLARHETAYVAAALDIILYTTWPPYQSEKCTACIKQKQLNIVQIKHNIPNYIPYIDILCIVPFATEYVDPKEPFRLTNDKNELKLIKAPMQETWRELEALVDAGLVRNIGISNFNVKSIVNLLSYARIPPSVL